MQNTINIILNGKPVKAYIGESILELSRRLGVEIPTLCSDERLEPFTSCYLCVVEIKGMRGLQPACSTRVNEGMYIETDNEQIHKARKTALELLLSTHYADCLAPCKQTCPAGINVQGYISFIEKGMYSEAVALIKETNPLPAVCGRVCVRPCEIACRRNFLNENHGVAIDYLKRFVADYDLSSENKWKPKVKPSTNKKVAIIGSGPAGLSAAFFLQKEGHQVDIYESAPKAGGWLRYGIPEYRLPNDILQKEIDNITELGVNIYYNQKLGENLEFKDIKNIYDAFLIAVGSQESTSIGCEGDDNANVLSGIDFLKQIELDGKPFDFKGKTVAVIGGGNTAMDCCRTAIRCGAAKVYVIYRRTENEMPANPIEIYESKLEGVEYMFLTAPVKINSNEKGELDSATCIKMKLGEPDASGRRRPVPIEGSEFDIKLDFILAATGQKTVANFIDEINNNVDKGQIKLNKWGYIETDKESLQTGIENIFAAGDCVTGPATIIQAIAQARIAANSINLYLHNKPITAPLQEFISKKENFKTLTSDDFIGKYLYQPRQEMPVLPPDKRNNFEEVESGYENEEIAKIETHRCLECGCNEYYTCDLRRYATQYNAVQTNYSGEFIEYQVDFRHPFIEIDNNKCILCARCLRICNDVVGASALSLINRGFKTCVAPAFGNALIDTDCESCGMCISACPTGAMSENLNFKPAPVILDKSYVICNYCSIGCKIELNHRNAFVMRVNGTQGQINHDANICRFPRFAYHFYNDTSRITKPLLKKNGELVEINFDEAFNIVSEKIKNSNPERNAFFVGARLSNEEIYLIQKLAKYAAQTDNIFSFHYLGRENINLLDNIKNVTFNEIKNASRLFLIGSDISKDNAVAGFKIFNAHKIHNIPVEIITENIAHQDIKKVDKTLIIKDYYYFVKAVNHYILSERLEDKTYINYNCSDFEKYKKHLLNENFNELCLKASDSEKNIIEFANDYINENNAIIVFSEKILSLTTIIEIINLALLTGKYGKTSSGIIALKEKNNSFGLIDMQIGKIATDNIDIFQQAHNNINSSGINILEKLDKNIFENIFIFGEDPVGCAKDKTSVEKWFNVSSFLMVQDYFMTETAKKANLILPASLPVETGGSFINTQHIIQYFEPDIKFNKGPVKNSLSQINEIINLVTESNNKLPDLKNIVDEKIKLIDKKNNNLHKLNYTACDSNKPAFKYGCDSLVKIAEEYFNSRLQK